MAFSLTILGSGPASPNAGGACSGYLLRHDDTRILVDCGHGVVGRLRAQTPFAALDAIVISHLHADHYIDLLPLYYGIKYGKRDPSTPTRRVPTRLLLPPGGRNHLRRVFKIVANHPRLLEEVFEVGEYPVGGAETALGSLLFTFHPVQHYIPSHAMRIRPANPPSPLLVFSSDAAPSPALVEAARDADLFLCESVWMDPAEDEADPARRGHLSAAEAGAAARVAGVKRLVLTHCIRDFGGPLDAHHLQSAAATFGGPVQFADESATYEV